MVVFVVIAYLIKILFKGSVSTPLDGMNNGTSTPVSTHEWTPLTLAPFNGKDNLRILIAVKGTVYDVSAGALFYGPSGPYANFAGRDALRGLALNSFDMEHLKDLHEPIDLLEDLSDEEMQSLDGWESLFLSKYPIAGKLLNPV